MGLFNKKNIYIEKNKTKEELKSEERIAELNAEANKSGDRILAERKIAKEHADDKKARPWAHDEFFTSSAYTYNIVFPESETDIAKTVERINATIRSDMEYYSRRKLSMQVGDVIKFMIWGWIVNFASIIQAFTGVPKEVEYANSAVAKAEEGIRKLNNISSSFDTTHISQELQNSKQSIQDVIAKNKKNYMIRAGLAAAFWGFLMIYGTVIGMK